MRYLHKNKFKSNNKIKRTKCSYKYGSAYRILSLWSRNVCDSDEAETLRCEPKYSKLVLNFVLKFFIFLQESRILLSYIISEEVISMLKKYPFIKQTGIKDCAAASLLMIIKYYKGYINIEQ